MKRFILIAFAALFITGDAAAQNAEPMTAQEFRALAQGWTLHFRDEYGEYFGSEQYLDNGQTVWLPRGGQCLRGVWSEESRRICFLYGVGLSCWRIYRDGEEGLYAESADGASDTRLWLIRRDKAPVLCPEGPGV